MTRTGPMALAAIASFAAQPLGAATPAAATAAQYDVQLVVRDGDAAPTNPRLLVRAGEPATFMITNKSYSLSVTATPDEAGRVSLASQVSTWSPDGLHTDGSTVTLDANGETSTILSPHAEPGTGAVTGMRIDVTVRPVTD